MEKTKTVYGYDPISFEFTGAQYAHLCPVTKNMYLMPANTVDFAPVDFEDGFAFVLENNKWVKIADERGKEVYSCETGEVVGHVNNLIGDVKENHTTLKPETGQEWDGEKWETPVPSIYADEAFIYALHAKYNQETIMSGGAEFGVDDKTRASITEAVLFLRDLGENALAIVDWSAENGFFELTLAQLETAILAIGVHRQKGFSARKTVLAELTDTTTKDQVTTRFNTLTRD
jgi:hypothetical protein